MVKKESDGVMFELGDFIKIFLDQSIVEGHLVREDCLGLTIRDSNENTKFRFVRWEAIEVIEYIKNRGKNGESW